MLPLMRGEREEGEVIMRRPVQIGLAPNVVLDSAFLPGAADAAGTGETDAAPAAGPALAGEQATPLLATLGVLGGAALCLAYPRESRAPATMLAALALPHAQVLWSGARGRVTPKSPPHPPLTAQLVFPDASSAPSPSPPAPTPAGLHSPASPNQSRFD